MHNLLLVYFVNLYMFRANLGPSSGGTTVCIQQLVLIILSRWVSVVLVGLELQSNLPMTGLDTPEICRGWWNILKLSCVSRWVFFTRLYRDARSTKHKIHNCGLGKHFCKRAVRGHKRQAFSFLQKIPRLRKEHKKKGKKEQIGERT